MWILEYAYVSPPVLNTQADCRIKIIKLGKPFAVEYRREWTDMRKVVFGGGAKLTWRSLRSRREIAKQLFDVHLLLNTVVFADEQWYRHGTDIRMTEGKHDDEDEWKHRGWWD